MKLVGLTCEQRDAVHAALRYLATGLNRGGLRPNDGDVGDILTSGGKHDGLTAEEVRDLCDKLIPDAWSRFHAGEEK
jgi:hypothetical protein